MKTACLTGKRKIEIIEMEKPRISDSGEVLIKIKSAGVCGSDRHYFVDGRIGFKVVQYPFPVGHECAGVIEEVGSAVKTVKPGDRVAVEPSLVCGKCHYCVRGMWNLCDELLFLGNPGQLEGCMKEYIVMPLRAGKNVDGRENREVVRAKSWNILLSLRLFFPLSLPLCMIPS